LDEEAQTRFGVGRSIDQALKSSHPDIDTYPNGHHIKDLSTVIPEHQLHNVTTQTFPSPTSQAPTTPVDPDLQGLHDIFNPPGGTSRQTPTTPLGTPRQRSTSPPSGGSAVKRLMNFAGGVASKASTKAGTPVSQEQMASAMGRGAAGLDTSIPKTSPIGIHTLIAEGIATKLGGTKAKATAQENFYNRIVGPANDALRAETAPTPPPSTSPPPGLS